MSKSKIALGAIFGAAAGFVTGILAAPKAGKETRDDLKEAALKAKDTVLTETEKAKGKAAEKAKEVRAKAEEVAEDVKATAGEFADEVVERATDVKLRAEQAVKAAKTPPQSTKKTK